MRKWHGCRYERIDGHLAGCTLCGFVHDCTKGHCAREGTIETGDAVVCSVTGLCIRETIFVENEFVDTVASYGRAPVQESRAQVALDTISELVAKLLASPSTERAHALEQRRWRNKAQSLAVALVNRRKWKGAVDLLGVVQDVLAAHPAPCVRQEAGLRMRVVEEVSECICRVVNTCMHSLKMHVRPSEVKVLVFGLCYLMRSGVHISGVTVIPKHPALEELLPPENSLSSIFSFRAKHITDIENKMKFLFRGVAKTDLRKLFV